LAIADYYLQAWTLPSSTPFEEVVTQIPFTDFSFGEYLNDIEANSVTLSAEFERLSSILDPANSVETLIRCFKTDGSEVGNFLTKDAIKTFTDNTTIRVSGPSVASEMHHAIVYPYDWVDEFTEVKVPDWEWGNPNRFLQNPGFEDSEIGYSASTGWESGELEGWGQTPNSGYWNDPDSFSILEDAGEARTGDWCVTFNADIYHSGMRKQFTGLEAGSRITGSVWVRSPTSGRRATLVIQVQSGYTNYQANAKLWNGIHLIHELGNVAYLTGATNGSYQQIQFDVTLGTNQTSTWITINDDEHGGGDGPVYYVDDFTMTGGNLGFEPWVGVASTLSLDTGTVRHGTNSLKVVTDGIGIDASGIGQEELTGLTIGQIYTLGFWVFMDTAGPVDFRSVIKDPETGTWLGYATTAVAQSVWTYVSVTWTATQETVDAQLVVGNASAITFYIDTNSFATGWPGTTIGDILQLLLTPMVTRNVLDWVKIDGWDASTDQDGATWTNQEVSVRVSRGMNMKQVLDLMTDYGAEWDFPWNSGASMYELRVYDNGNAGTDKSALDEGRIIPGTGFKDADLILGSPGANRVLAEGEGLTFAEENDATRASNYGRRETYKGDTSYMSNAQDVADQHMRQQFTRQEVRARFIDIDGKDQWDKYQVGDTFHVDLQPDINEELRISSKRITASKEQVTVSVTLLRPEVFEASG